MRNSLPVSIVAELIAFAKTNRGKLNFASTGIGTTPHLTGEMLKRWLQSTSPPYRNSAPALNDRLVGAVDAVIDNTTSIVPQARAGSIGALGISTLTRSPLAPDFAPIADTVPGFAALAFSGTPAEICDSVEAAVKAVCKDPVLIERMTPLLAEVVGSGAKEFGEFIAAERANGENCSPTSKSVSATSLKPLFAGDTPAPTQAYAAEPFGSRRWPGARLPRPMPRSG